MVNVIGDMVFATVELSLLVITMPISLYLKSYFFSMKNSVTNKDAVQVESLRPKSFLTIVESPDD